MLLPVTPLLHVMFVPEEVKVWLSPLHNKKFPGGVTVGAGGTAPEVIVIVLL
jgi:hypothetical protein